MDCNQVEKLLNAYIDKELDHKTNIMVRNHLVDCENCYKDFLLYKEIKDSLNSLSEVEPSEEFSKELCTMFQKGNLPSCNYLEMFLCCFSKNRKIFFATFACVFAFILAFSFNENRLNEISNLNKTDLDNVSRQIVKDSLSRDIKKETVGKSYEDDDYFAFNNSLEFVGNR